MLRCIFSQLEAFLGPRVASRCLLPPTCLHRRLFQDEERVKLPVTGEVFIVNKRAREASPVVPPDFVIKAYLLTSHTVDRCSVGAAGLHFVMGHCGMLWHVSWDPCHDMWNAIKTAAKRAAGGYLWR